MRKLNSVCMILVFLLSVLIPFEEFADAASPTISTNNVTGISTTNATLQGTITNDGNSSFKYEHFDRAGDFPVLYDHSGWGGQSFTTTASYHIKTIGLKLYRSGSPGIVTISIRATNPSTGKPTGSNLSVGTTNGNTLTTSTVGEWRNISMSWYLWSSSIKYAIIVSISTVSPDEIGWQSNKTSGISPDYAGGNPLYYPYGSSWVVLSGYDKLFRVYGDGCNASFQYGTTTGYGTTTSNQTKFTGNTVSQNIASLTNGRLYHYRLKAINPDGTTNGADKTFLTKPGITTNITTTSYPTAIKIGWTKGLGANRTVVRVNSSSYPSTPSSGASLYNGTGTTVNDTGLLPGHTYFYSIWSFTSWGSLSQYSSVFTCYAATIAGYNSSFFITFPQYKEAGEDITVMETLRNSAGLVLNNIWVYTYICNQTGVNLTNSLRGCYVVNGFYYYTFSTSTMTPGVYYFHSNCTSGGTKYNATNILYLGQPGGAGHARAMVYFLYYNTNQGIGLPSETLQLFVNDTQIFTYPLFCESYVGAKINVKVKDYYNSTMFQSNFTINKTIESVKLGLTFHSWLFGNTNSKYYMISLLKANATRWWERGIVPNGQVEYLIPSGTYRMRIYDANYHELINQSYNITNSRVYVINGTNLTLVINGQSVIIGQLLELRGDFAYALTPDVVVKGTNPPLIYSVYDTEGMSLGNGVYKICPALVTIATTKVVKNGLWVNTTPGIPTNGTLSNGTVTILSDALYIAGNASIGWVNVSYTSNHTILQNTTYIPSVIALYGQNITIRAPQRIVVRRETKYNQVRKFYWTYYSYEGRYNAGINISDPMAVPIYDVYCYAEFANDSNPDFSSVTMRDIANNGTIMKRGQNFDVSAGGVHFYLLSINGSSSRGFTIEYKKSVSESFSYGNAETTVNGYSSTVFQGGSYQYFLVDWVNTGSLIFKGTLTVKLNFSKVSDINPSSVVVQDRDHNIVLSSDGVVQAGDMLLIGSSILGDVNPGGGRSFAVYFLFNTYPGASPTAYKMTTPLFILFGVVPVTMFLIGIMVCGSIVTAAALLYFMDRRGKRAHAYMVLMAIFSFGIFFFIVLQLAGY